MKIVVVAAAVMVQAPVTAAPDPGLSSWVLKVAVSMFRRTIAKAAKPALSNEALG